MEEVGIRALKQNASEVVAHAAAGEIITITDRGRPVVQMTAIRSSAIQRLLDAGRARPPKRRLIDLPAPTPGPKLSRELSAMRDAEQY
jgi:prevent-host-death family protein